jgi:nitrile hydratase
VSGTHHDLEEHGHNGVKPSAEAWRYAARIRAIEALLVEKGVLTKEDVRRQIEYMESRSPASGARLVARAWVDPGFKALLLSDTKAAALELGIDASGPVEFVTVENTPEVHNLIVCTLCSCYPRAILGRPPDWYKSFSVTRTRQVRRDRR